MTLLFALFVVLFATTRHSSDALGRLSGAIHSGFNGVPREAATSDEPLTSSHTAEGSSLDSELRAVLGPAMERHEVSLQQSREGLVLSFRELGFFRSGEADVLPGQASLIEQTGSILKRHNAVLRVEGHSDNQPIHNAVFASNWELSAARAMTVLLLLVDETHYDPTRLSMAGYGPYRPVADNATLDGRQKNRRVDLVVLESSDDTIISGPSAQAAASPGQIPSSER